LIRFDKNPDLEERMDQETNILVEPTIDDGKPLPPLADPVNAEIFSSVEQAGEAMRTLLNDVLDDSGDMRIEKILNLIPQKYKPSAQDRSYRIDVYGETSDNELVIFEVSLDKYLPVVDRSFIYSQQAISQKIPKGVNWREMPTVMPKRVIMLNILNFIERQAENEDEKKTLDFHQIVEHTYRQPPRKLASKRFFTHNLELPRFRKKTVDFSNNLHCWLYLLTQAQDKRITLQEVVNGEPRLAEFAKREGVKQYMMQYAVASANPQARSEYFSWALNEMLAQEDLRLQRAEAKNEGIEIGEQRGIGIGEQREIEKGEQKMRNLAMTMRFDGKPEDEVIRYTGYTFVQLDAYSGVKRAFREAD